MKDYESENCTVELLSDLMVEDAKKMVGKTVERIEAREYSITITFSDGSKFAASGYRWGDSAMGAEYSDK